MHDYPWPLGGATGIGSYPGDDVDETMRMVLGELPDLPHLPELPNRGPGADMIGRAAGLLVELPVGLQPSGWRFTDRPGHDAARARDFLSRDLDAMEEQAGGYRGPFKIQVAGPWTLAGAIELKYGDRALADTGAVREMIVSLSEGIATHVAEVRKRLPGAAVLVQLDEPGLPGVLAGTVPTASGFSRLAAVEPPIAEDGLRQVIEAVDGPVVVHCCAPAAPLDLLRGAGAAAISVDLRLFRDEDAIGEAVEAGTVFLLGAVPGVDTTLPDPARSVEPIRRLWHRLGFAPDKLAGSVVVTPSCGLAGASPRYARAALAHCRAAGRSLRDNPE